MCQKFGIPSMILFALSFNIFQKSVKKYTRIVLYISLGQFSQGKNLSNFDKNYTDGVFCQLCKEETFL